MGIGMGIGKEYFFLFKRVEIKRKKERKEE
jgi:hypothetical protein